MIAQDIDLARSLYRLIDEHSEFEAFSHHLSITTFRFVPEDLNADPKRREAYLDKLNTEILTRLQESGEAFVSNAIINGRYALRACIVNFRTSPADINELPDIIARIGRQLDDDLRKSL